MFDKEVSEKVKKERGEVYFGEIGFDDKEGKSHQVEFLFRRPLVADIEAYQKSVQKSPFVAQENLLRSLIVYPAQADEVLGPLHDYPTPIGQFVDAELSPFFGANARTGSHKL